MNELWKDPARFQRLGYILVWIEAVFGGVLLAGCWPLLTHGIFAALLVAVLLCTASAQKSRPCRVTARVIVGLFWVLAAMLAVETVDTALHAFSGMYVEVLQDGVVWFGGLFFCYMAPASAAVMLYFGENTAGYDCLVACLLLPVQLVSVCVALFTDAGVLWTFDGRVLPYIWLCMVAITVPVLWRCARLRTPAQESVIIRRREKRAAKRAARQGKKH